MRDGVRPGAYAGQLEVARQIDLHAVALTNRDGRQPVQEALHHLRVACRSHHRSARDDDRAVRVSAAEAGRPDELTESRDQAHGRRRAEGGQVVLVHAVAQARVPDLVEPQELIERVRAAIRQHEPVERDGEARLAERLHRRRLAEHARAGRNQDVLPAVRVHRVRDQAVDGRGECHRDDS